MKQAIKTYLQNRNLYYGLKYSKIFRLYQLLLKPQEIKKEQKEESFYKSFLKPCNLIFDIGANDGHKTEAFLKIAKSVVCCEPDEENFKILQTRFRNKKKNVFLEKKAVADIEGEKTFYIHHAGSAFNTLSPQWKETLEKDNIEKWNEKIQFTDETVVAVTTVDLLIKKYGTPHFIKIDVEGFEEYVLNGLSQKIPFLSFEALLPDGYKELKNCLARVNYLDNAATYNVVTDEELLLPDFVSYVELLKWLDKSHVMHLEIVVAMCTLKTNNAN